LVLDGNAVDDNPSAEYIRPIFERSLAEQEEAFGHVASRLSEIAEEVMKKYSWGGGHSCMAYVDDPMRTGELLSYKIARFLFTVSIPAPWLFGM